MNFTKCQPVKKSRTKKHCEWCGEVCEIGQPLIKVSGVWEGDFFAYRHHPDCNAAWSKWWDLNRMEYEGPEEHCMKRGTLELKEGWK